MLTPTELARLEDLARAYTNRTDSQMAETYVSLVTDIRQALTGRTNNARKGNNGSKRSRKQEA